MFVKCLKWFAICFVILLSIVMLYWWSNLPFHDLPVVNNSNISTPIASNFVRQPTFRDISYSDQSRFQKLDIYLPYFDSGPFPLVIWIHGGGLIMGDKSSMPQTDFGPAPTPTSSYGPYQVQVPDVDKLNSEGYAVASLNYRLGATPVTAANSAIKDSKAAIRFLRSNAKKFNIAPNSIAVWGNSMGGYLAAMVGVTGDRITDFDDPEIFNLDRSSAVQAVIVWYGAEDRMPGRSLDLIHQISEAKSLPPFLIVNGDKDPVITPEQAFKLNEALEKANADTHLTILTGAGHEDPIFRKTQMPPTLEFLRKSLQ